MTVKELVTAEKNGHLRRVVRRPEVLHLTGLSNSALDRLIRADQFPKPFKLIPDEKSRAVGWSLQAVLEWIESREQEAA